MYRTRYLFAETNENMIRTDSQDYGSDEISFTSKNALFHKTPRIANKITILFGVSPQLFRTIKTIHAFSSPQPPAAKVMNIFPSMGRTRPNGCPQRRPIPHSAQRSLFTWMVRVDSPAASRSATRPGRMSRDSLPCGTVIRTTISRPILDQATQ